MCFAVPAVAAAVQRWALRLAAAAWSRRAAEKLLAVSRLRAAALRGLASAAVLSAAVPVVVRDVRCADPHADPHDGPRGVLDARARRPVGAALASGLATARPETAAGLACAQAVARPESVLEAGLACAQAVALPAPALAAGPVCAVAAAPAPAARLAVLARRPVAVPAVAAARAALGVVPGAVAAVRAAWAAAAQPLAVRALPALYRAILPASFPGPSAAGSRPAPKGSARPSRLRRKLAGTRRPAPAVRCWPAEASGSSCGEMLRRDERTSALRLRQAD